MASITPSTFGGFDNTKYLYSILEADRHKDLRHFAEKLFIQVSSCNKARKVDPLVGEKGKFLDSMATLLTGDETCAAIAISGPNVLIGTNRTGHDLKAATYAVTAVLVRRDGLNFKVRLKCILKIDKGPSLEQMSSDCVTFKFEKGMWIAESGNRLHSFVFKAPSLIDSEDDSVVKLSFTLKKDAGVSSLYWMKNDKGQEEYEMQRPVVTYVGSLQRRATKVINNLSLIAKVIFEKERWKPEKRETELFRKYSAFVESKYKECSASGLSQTPDGFIAFIDNESKETLAFSTEDEHKNFVATAREHYCALVEIDKDQQCLEANTRWVQILRDSLTYELSKHYPNQIWIDIETPAAKGEIELRDLYLALMRTYREYVGSDGKRSVSSIETWLEAIPDKFHTGELKAPKAVLDDPQPFLKEVRRYLVGIENREQLGELYEALVADYLKFKGEWGCGTSVSSVKKWLDIALPKLNSEEFNVPKFILDKPEKFLERIPRYFIALARVEEHVKKDAESNGVLTNLLVKESIFKKSIAVKLIGGKDGVHAEMRLLDHHLTSGAPSSDYYGIAMLCCALCNYTLQQLRLAGAHGVVADTRGTHSTLHDKWILMNAFNDDRFLKPFLGDPLFQHYQSLRPKVRHLDALMKNGKRKDESQYKMSDVALKIIPRLGGINNLKALRRLHIDPNYLIQGSDKVFAEEGE